MKPQIFHDNIADQNSYLCTSKDEAFVVDPGFNGAAILAALEAKNLRLSFILMTHGHYDHLRDVKILQEKREFTLVIEEADVPNLYDTSLNYATAFNGSFRLKQAQKVQVVKDGDELPFGSSKITVWHTPGHTAGSACYLYQKFLFSGDTLFCGSVGRTDLAGGSPKMMKDSIQRLFSGLPNDMLVYPGHEEMTSIGAERESNPFLGAFHRK